MTESQKQFEEWAISTEDQFGLPLFIIKSVGGKYVDHHTEISWQAWQASRQSVVVVLPENIDFPAWVSGDVIDGYKSALGDVRDALDAAGVSYE